MPTKKRTKAKRTSKSSSSFSVFKVNSPLKGLLLFLGVFAVIGGTVAVYRSFALNWQHVQDLPAFTLSACRADSNPKSGSKVLWAVYNKTSTKMGLFTVYENMNHTQAGPISVPGKDIKTLTGYTEAGPGTYHVNYYQNNTPYLFDFSLDPSQIVGCSAGK